MSKKAKLFATLLLLLYCILSIDAEARKLEPTEPSPFLKRVQTSEGAEKLYLEYEKGKYKSILTKEAQENCHINSNEVSKLNLENSTNIFYIHYPICPDCLGFEPTLKGIQEAVSKYSKASDQTFSFYRIDRMDEEDQLNTVFTSMVVPAIIVLDKKGNCLLDITIDKALSKYVGTEDISNGLEINEETLSDFEINSKEDKSLLISILWEIMKASSVQEK